MENICEYCGQVMTDEAAVCSCPGTMEKRERERKIESAVARIHQLFGEQAGEFGFRPIQDEEVIEHMESAAALIAGHRIGTVTITIGRTTAKLSSGTKGKISVERGYATKCKLEE